MTDQPPPNPYASAPQGAAQTYADRPAYAAGSPWGPLAGWGSRVGAMLIDSLVAMIGLVPYVVGIPFLVAGMPDTSYDPQTGTMQTVHDSNGAFLALGILLMVVGFVLSFAIQVWNRAFKQGRTGQSIGKKVLGLKLVGERTGQPMGAGMAFVRDLAHTLDGFFYLGYLWPLWDDKRQTFADKILDTVVVRVPPQ